MAIHSFSCSCGWHADLRVGYEDHVVPCPECSAPASRASVYSINAIGFARTPLDKTTYHQEFKDFTEAGAELEYAHSRMEEAAGKQLPTPPLARIAMANAKRLQSLGVKDSADLKERNKH